MSRAERRQADKLSLLIKERRAFVVDQQRKDIENIRGILDKLSDQAQLRLGGLPMIVADMLDYILKDVIVFGSGILIFIIGLLSTIFIRPRWVVLSVSCCVVSVVLMLGYLGLVRWPVTVVSANFVALLLIFSLSLTVHLIVRYRELHGQNPPRGSGLAGAQYGQGQVSTLFLHRDDNDGCVCVIAGERHSPGN